MNRTPTTVRVPGHDVEVQLRPIFYGQTHGYRYGVRVLEVRDRPVKDDWRQIGSETVYDTEEQARAAANAEYARIAAGEWRRTA